MDQQLTRRQRAKLKMHMFMCKFCSRVQQQMQFIRKVIQHSLIDIENSYAASDINLSPEASERIKRALDESRKIVEPEKSN